MLKVDLKAEMTPPGTLVDPLVSNREKALLEAKYIIFHEAIDMQKRWRSKVDEALRPWGSLGE